MNPPFLFKICWRRVFTSGGNPFLTCRGVPGQSGRVTRFRPCIDLHDGRVKQIVGGSLKDQGDQAAENFVSEQDAAFYAELYRKSGLKGGHVILLNGKDSPYYEATRKQALLALGKYPGGLQIGGGINPENAPEYLEAWAAMGVKFLPCRSIGYCLLYTSPSPRD